MPHACLLLTLGEKRVLFTADADYTLETFPGLPPLDAVFVNPLFFRALRTGRFFQGALPARTICVYHVPFPEDDRAGCAPHWNVTLSTGLRSGERSSFSRSPPTGWSCKPTTCPGHALPGAHHQQPISTTSGWWTTPKTCSSGGRWISFRAGTWPGIVRNLQGTTSRTWR